MVTGTKFNGQYKIYEEIEVKDAIRRCIEHVVDVTGMSEEEGTIVLCNSEWNQSLVVEEWFEKNENIRRRAGLVDGEVVPLSSEIHTCPSCYEDFPSTELIALNCNHYFCTSCWNSFINAEMGKGKEV